MNAAEKRQAFCTLYLASSSLYVHVDARHPDLQLPKHLLGQPHVMLQLGHGLAIKVPDLQVDDLGITCTLSFNRSPFWCAIPWACVFAVVSADDPDKGALWDPPPEAIAQSAAPSAQEKRKTLPPGWRVIDGAK